VSKAAAIRLRSSTDTLVVILSSREMTVSAVAVAKQLAGKADILFLTPPRLF